MEKVCTRCGVKKDVYGFSIDKGFTDGRKTICKNCVSDYNKNWYSKNREKELERGRIKYRRDHEKNLARNKLWREQNPQYAREIALQRKYGITISKYNKMLKSQGGVCAICTGDNNKRAFHVDHNHNTGKVRGLLCSKCNAGIGYFKDTIQLLRMAALYIYEKDV